jgi:hypothetical protein
VNKLTAALGIILLSATPALAGGHSHHKRSSQVTREFQKEHPCPSTGLTYGACPGYIKDHVKPLCKGGADAVWNLQWQTKADAAAKDKWECK